jgi:hypothetical protein
MARPFLESGRIEIIGRKRRRGRPRHTVVTAC